MSKFQECVFCDWNKIKDDVIAETPNLFVKIGIGIVTAGQTMIISKAHYACYAETPKNLDKEYADLESKLVAAISEQFSEPFAIECAGILQSVHHAHTHYIPSRSSNPEYTVQDIVREMQFPSYFKVQETNMNGLRKLWQEQLMRCGDLAAYIRMQQQRKLWVAYSDGLSKEGIIDDVNIRHFMNVIKRVKEVPLSWKDITEEQKLADEGKRKFTKDRLKGKILL